MCFEMNPVPTSARKRANGAVDQFRQCREQYDADDDATTDGPATRCGEHGCR
jgi:hypothetical protein